MESLGQIEACLETDFGPGELTYFVTPRPVVIDMIHKGPRVPLLRRDGPHTRFVKGGVRPGRGSNDLRPLSLNTGQISIYDILKEAPSSTSDSPSTDFRTAKSKTKTPKKEAVAKKIPFDSIRKIFSPKQTSSESKSTVLELQQAFTVRAHLDTEDQEAATTPHGSESSISPTTADQWQQDLAAHISLPGFVEAHGVAPHQSSGDGGCHTLSQHGCETSRQRNSSNGNKQRVITPLKIGRTVGSEHTSPLRSPRAYFSPVIPNPSPASDKIYGQPPLEMVSPVIPRKVTKEHLNLSSFPSLSREVIAQLPKELEPTMPIFGDCGSPNHYSQPVSPQFAPGRRNCQRGQGNASNDKMVSGSASADQLRDNFVDSGPQSPRSALRHEESMSSLQDEPKTPEDFLGYPLPDVKYKKNGKVKKYKDNDPMMVNLGFVAIEEIYGRQAAIDRFAGPGIVKAATWETQRAMEEEEEKLIGLGISSRTSAQTFEARETRHRRCYSNESNGSIVHSPVTPRSGYVTPQTPKERQEFYENLHKPVVKDDEWSKKVHGDFGLSSIHIHENDASAAQSPFDDPHLSFQSTTMPYTLGAPGRQSSGRRRKHSGPNTHDAEPHAEATSAFEKIQRYFYGCTPDSIRNTRLYMSTKEMRAEIFARLREITGTQCVYPGQTKHPNHGRHFHDRNLRCTEHMGHCAVCNTACCVYYEAIEAARDAATAYDQEFANEVGRSISEASLYADDLTTYLRCIECSRMICPDCIGICPVDLCQLISCKVGRPLTK
ncbi:MAG: hypothetical protein L6R42_007680 [Xanthoria sp. 1 TBL-2021]|nr:MAG: hypothetical protein L6R42_007680 [Xanthoria sp. 1 TBL-2021]